MACVFFLVACDPTYVTACTDAGGTSCVKDLLGVDVCTCPTPGQYLKIDTGECTGRGKSKSTRVHCN